MTDKVFVRYLIMGIGGFLIGITIVIFSFIKLPDFTQITLQIDKLQDDVDKLDIDVTEYTGTVISYTGVVATGIIDEGYYIAPDEFVLPLTSGFIYDRDKNINSKPSEQYPKILINSKNIEKVLLVFEVDFTEYYINTYSNFVYGKTLDGRVAYSPFAFKFFLGDVFSNQYGVETMYGGWYDVQNVALYSRLDLRNLSQGTYQLHGALEGKEIVGGHEYVIPGSKIYIAKENRQGEDDNTFVFTSPIEYMKKNIGKPLAIGGRLSASGIEHTVIKSMKMIYVGEEGAIEIYND